MLPTITVSTATGHVPSTPLHRTLENFTRESSVSLKYGNFGGQPKVSLLRSQKVVHILDQITPVRHCILSLMIYFRILPSCSESPK
jgi:hypothetical protein